MILMIGPRAVHGDGHVSLAALDRDVDRAGSPNGTTWLGAARPLSAPAAVRFLVALARVQDLLLCAKHLFVAAIWLRLGHIPPLPHAIPTRMREASTAAAALPARLWKRTCASQRALLSCAMSSKRNDYCEARRLARLRCYINIRFPHIHNTRIMMLEHRLQIIVCVH
jgi:hypothetical protein